MPNPNFIILILKILTFASPLLIIISGVFYDLNYAFNYYDVNKKGGIHAEINCINTLRVNNKNPIAISIFVCRISIKDNCLIFSMSKPCKHCIDKMQNIANKKGYNIKNVYFTNNLGNVEKEKYKDLLNSTDKHISRYNRR